LPHRIAEHSRSDPKVFGNRALTRIKLSDWPNAESDARKAVELNGPKNKSGPAMKAHFYLAQALLPQRHVGEALEEAKIAYSICIEIQDPSADVIGGFILRAKQAKWQEKETARLRELNETLALVEDLLDAQLQRDIDAVEERFQSGQVGQTGRVEEIEELQHEAELRRSNIRKGFEDSKRAETVQRVSPHFPSLSVADSVC
jgi:STIP1 homology and U-box containing protein 1